MQDLSLAALQAFAAVARHGGFRRAASELGVSPSALSHTVGTLERRIGTRLLNRTTRSVAVTEAGQRLLERMTPLLDELAAAVDEASSAGGAPHGTLRLNASPLAVATVLGPRLPGFLARFPDVQVDVTVDNDGRDLVGRGFDATVRLETWVESDLIALPVGPRLRGALAASPAYLRDNPPPLHPDELGQHLCIRYRFDPNGGPLRWPFADAGPAAEPHGPLTTTDLPLAIGAALAGGGILYVAEPSIRACLDDGRLVPLLERWWPGLPAVSVFYPGRRQMPSALRALLDFLRTPATGPVSP